MFGWKKKEKAIYTVEWKRTTGTWEELFSSRKKSKAIKVLKKRAFHPLAVRKWRLTKTVDPKAVEILCIVSF